MAPLIFVDLGFGDSGKGTCVSAACKKFDASFVIRFNGGGQAAHHVYTDDGRSHCFSQFGSGTFTPGVHTFLSRHMMVNPIALLNEEVHLRSASVTNAFERLHIDMRALVTTPYHQLANRLRENARGDVRHGSCGMGIAETVMDSIERPCECIRMSDIETGNENHLAEKLSTTMVMIQMRLPEYISQLFKDLCPAPSQVAKRLLQIHGKYTPCGYVDAARILRSDGLIFEGAQGILLDEDYGFHPHTTWSRCTSANAVSLLREVGNETNPIRIGVTRTFMTRHGDGPFPTEDDSLRHLISDDDNMTGEFQGRFRVGNFDADLIEHAIQVNGGLDYLAVTHCDKIDWLGNSRFGIPIMVKSYGKRPMDKVWSFEAECLSESRKLQ